eukprot:g3106.t1
MRLLVVVFFLACAARLVAADGGGGTKCAACGIVVGLLEEKQVKSFEVSLILDLLCSGNSACKAQKKAAKSMIESQASPDDVCGKTLGLCATSCKLFGTWPLNSLPPAPPQDPKNKGRRRTSSVSEKMMHLKEISRQLEEDSESFKDDFYGMVKFLQRLFVAGPGRKSALDKAVEAASRANLDSHPCGSNFTCIKDRFLQYHLPVSDTDGDAFATVKNRGLRGSHFRGADCDERIVLHANDSFIKVTGFNAVQIAAGGVGMFQMTTEEELAEMYLHAGELIRGDVSALCMKKSCKIADGKTAIFNVKMAIIRPPAPRKATAQSEPGCAGGNDCGPATSTSNGFFHCCIFPDGQTSL